MLARHDILMWADDVICGFGGSGNDFGCNTVNIESPAQVDELVEKLASGLNDTFEYVARAQLLAK